MKTAMAMKADSAGASPPKNCFSKTSLCMICNGSDCSRHCSHSITLLHCNRIGRPVFQFKTTL
jgi:hypothetical protein